MSKDTLHSKFLNRILSCLKSEFKKNDIIDNIKNESNPEEYLEKFIDEFQSEMEKGLEVQLIANTFVVRDKEGNIYEPATKISFDYSSPFAFANGRIVDKKRVNLDIIGCQLCCTNGWFFSKECIDPEILERVLSNPKLKKFVK